MIYIQKVPQTAFEVTGLSHLCQSAYSFSSGCYLKGVDQLATGVIRLTTVTALAILVAKLRMNSTYFQEKSQIEQMPNDISPNTFKNQILTCFESNQIEKSVNFFLEKCSSSLNHLSVSLEGLLDLCKKTNETVCSYLFQITQTHLCS